MIFMAEQEHSEQCPSLSVHIALLQVRTNTLNYGLAVSVTPKIGLMCSILLTPINMQYAAFCIS